MGKILAEIAGRIVTLLAVYDEDFYNLLCDEAGHLQIDVLESALPEGAATETTLDEIMDRLGALTSPAGGSTNAQLADVVARIGALSGPAGGSTNKLLTDALMALELIDDLYGALHSQHTDELDVVVESSALPDGATTETTLGLVKDRIGALSGPAGGSTNKLLTDALTALELIDNLYGALHSQNTDELVVRGEDQLHSFKGVLAAVNAGNLSANDGYIESAACSANEIWHVTNIYVVNTASATSRITMNLCHDATEYPYHSKIIALALLIPYSWHGHCWLDPSDTIRIYLIGGLINDACSVRLVGEIMTLEA